MRSKILIIMFAMLLLAPLISAADFDNVKSYDIINKKITVTNAFGLGDTIAEITLETPLHNKVFRGKDKLVAEFTINNMESYEDFLNNLELFDLNDDWYELDREINYKYKINSQVDVNDYEYTCDERLVSDKNGSYVDRYNCVNNIIGTHKETRSRWEPFNEKAILDAKVITIGIFTDVYVGDHVEWIPTLYGVEIDEWADWTEAMADGLVSAWKFDEGVSNTTDDSFGSNDLVMNDATVWSLNGKDNTGLFFNDTSQMVHTETTTGLPSGDANFSVSLWWNFSDASTEQTLAQFGAYGNDNQIIFWQYNYGTNLIISGFSGAGNEMQTPFGGGTATNEFVHFVFTHLAGGNITLWSDGVVLESEVVGSPNLDLDRVRFGVRGDSGNNMNGTIDEVLFYDKTLNQAEIEGLYDSGVGSFYGVTTVPTVTLNNPSDTYSTTDKTVLFNCSAIDTTSLLNVSLYINGELNLTVDNSTATDTYLEISQNYTFANGDYNWTCDAVDADYFSDTTSTRTFSITAFTENSQSYNLTSYQTKDETFYLNISGDGVQPYTATLNYNGTEYTSTKTGNDFEMIFERNIPLPKTAIDNTTFYWNVTYSGTTTGSTINQQNVTEPIFHICNSTLTGAFLNLSFADESNLSAIPMQVDTSTWYYWLGNDASVNKTFIYSNTTANDNYAWCTNFIDYPVNIQTEFRYSDTSYPQRFWDNSSTALTNSTVDLTLYSLLDTNGDSITFQVINDAEQSLEGVAVVVSRDIGGVSTIIETGTTDAAGTVSFWLDGDYLHTITFTLAGYSDYSTSLNPTESSYTISLGGAATTTINDYNQEVGISILPSSSDYLLNDTTYNFNLTITSEYWEITEYGFIIYNSTTTNAATFASVSDTTNGGTIGVDLDTGLNKSFYMDIYWIIEGNRTNHTGYAWSIYEDYDSEFSILNFFDDVKTYTSNDTEEDGGIFGLREWGRGLLIFIFIFVFIGTMNYKYGLTSPSGLMALVFSLILFLDVGVGLLPRTTLNGITYPIITILVFILFAGTIFQEASR